MSIAYARKISVANINSKMPIYRLQRVPPTFDTYNGAAHFFLISFPFFLFAHVSVLTVLYYPFPSFGVYFP